MGGPTGNPRPWVAHLLFVSFLVGWLFVLGVALAIGGILERASAIILRTVLALAVFARLLFSTGHRRCWWVNILRRRRFRWSELQQIRLAEDAPEGRDDRTLQFVARPSSPGGEPRRVRARAAAVREAKLRLLVETLNAYARQHGVPSNVTEAGRDRREDALRPR